MLRAKRGRGDGGVDLDTCTLSTLPSDTLSVQRSYDVLYRLLELLPLYYTSKLPAEQRMSEALIVRIIAEARSRIAADPVVVNVSSPVYVCGDLHGQYYDLINIFHRCPPPVRVGHDAAAAALGSVSGNKDSDDGSDATTTAYSFLFLGDYVDRGARSIEVMVTLLALKIVAPSRVTLLRGNHEDEQIMFVYGFFDECKRRYSVRLFKLFADLFHVLPFAALVNRSIFCMHGGLSCELQCIDDVPDARPCVVPHSGVLCDLLWADPELDMPPGVDWAPSSRRISSVFSRDALTRFLRDNDLDLIVRAHQVVEEGFSFFPSSTERLLLTIFSATNYCSEFGNHGGVLCVDADGVCSILTLDPPSFAQQRDIARVRDSTVVVTTAA